MALTPEQRKNIATALRVARKMGAPPKAQKALIEAMGVESSYRNLNYGDRDSVGVLQQRPSQGWGPAGEPVRKDVRQFLERAIPLAGKYRTPGELAQAVQRSAFPERYDQRSGEADRILAKFAKGRIGGSSVGFKDGHWNTKPGTDNSAQRQMLLQQYVLGNVGDPLQLALALKDAQDTPATKTYTPGKAVSSPSQARSAPKGSPGSISELFYDPQGGWKNGTSVGAIGGHGDHVHAASTDPRTVLRLGRLAQRMGLRVGENPAFGDRVDPVHTQGSYHYRTVNFHGRKVGEAIDVSGDPKLMARFTRRVRRKYGLS